ALLALAVSMSDGHIDTRESTVIRSFFAERYAGLDDAQERRRAIGRCLDETLNQLRTGQMRVKTLIHEICDELGQADDVGVAQTAYELCARVVASDDTVGHRERRALSLVAEELSLPESFVR